MRCWRRDKADSVGHTESPGSVFQSICTRTIGYLSHLGADLLTSSGLRLAWPSRQRQAIPLCRTGSFGESIIVAGVAIWAGVTLLRRHPMFGL
jgi:membrane-bound metal-dependent hydrolase YbcI (DUF457 family)